MNSKLVLIATVIIAALIIGGAVTYAVMVGQGANNSAAAPANGGPMTEQVTVPDSLAVCNAGEKCLVVDTTCSYCCKYVAINARHEQLFDEMYAQSCASYEGNMCECFDLNSYPSCVAGKCTMVKMPITP